MKPFAFTTLGAALGAAALAGGWWLWRTRRLRQQRMQAAEATGRVR